MTFRRPPRLWTPLFGVLTLLLTASLAPAQLDTIRVYGNGDGPSIDGTVTSSADFSNSASGQYSITAGGSDIWGNSDNGVFIHEAGATTAGDFTAIVRSASFGGPDPLAGEWGRTGPMARADDGSAADAANVMTTQKSGGGVGLTQQGRRSNGGGTERDGGEWGGTGGLAASGGVPVWLALSRVTLPEGPVFTSHYAEDVGGAPGPWSDPRARPVTGDLMGDLTVGLAHQSHSIPRVNTANFDNWSLGPYDNTLPAFTIPDANTGRFTYAQQPDGTWNRLELHQSFTGANYQQALDNAVAEGGHLFTPRSRMENAAGGGLVYGTSAWIGLNDNAAEGDWVLIDGAGESVWSGMGTDAGGTPVGSNYHNWNGGGEPNNAGAGENGGQILSNGRWNDNNHVGASLAYVIEFDSGLAAQPDPAPGLAQGAQGAWNIRRTATSGGIENVRAVEAVLYSGQHSIADYQSPTINFYDQDSGDGLIGGGTPFPGDDPDNPDENNFALYARAMVEIETGGDYTFGFYGDDGSELQISGQTFTSSTNIGDGGNVNLLESNLPAVANDGDRIAYPNPTGSGSVLGVVNLTPGVYDLTYTFYENGGGAHAEVFAAPGVHTVFDDSVFLAIGAPSPGLQLVPEPTSLALAGFGLALLGLVRRRRK